MDARTNKLSLSQLKELSNEELRVRVAEACGWKGGDLVNARPTWNKEGHRTPEGWDDFYVYELPDYDTPLDAIAEAEKTLSDEEHWKFRSTLWDLTDDPKGLPSDGERHNRDYCQSDARLRAIAFVFVRGHLG